MPNNPEHFTLVFFTPPQFLPQIKEAIFAAGAGSHPGPGSYTEVCFTCPGIGQFKPGADAKPAIGKLGELEEVGEVRVETVCVGREVVQGVVEALKRVHPYETPVYQVYQLEDF